MFKTATICLVLLAAAARGALARQLDPQDIERGRLILRNIHDELARHYYDTTFHGVNLDERFRQAAERMAAATSNSQLFAMIAQPMFELNDSHTTFWPPERAADVHYGFRLQMFGDTCYVAAVEAGSDAAARGVHAGDQVIAVDRFPPSRADFWKMEYVVRQLAPRATINLMLRSITDGRGREVPVASQVRPKRQLVDLTGGDGGMDIWELIREYEKQSAEYDDEFVTVDNRTLVWRMATFNRDNDDLDAAVDRARRHANLVLDLRGNGGGLVRALERLSSRIFPASFVMDSLRRRSGTRPESVIVRGDRFEGQLIVLIDSRSASAAEMFARTVQLQHRGVVLGDRSAGAVMQSRFYRAQQGGARAVLYGISITNADVIMPDGARLEVAGVVPDELIVPDAAEIGFRRDPVLARALQRLGHTTDAAAAGQLMPSARGRGMW